jgi:nicotinate-nucleotide pyrophosphorylase (carboxylating)
VPGTARLRLDAPPQLTAVYLAAKVAEALDEDGAAADVTTEAVVPSDLWAEAELVAGADGVVAGLPVAAEAFRQVDRRITVAALAPDGSPVRAREVLVRVEGPLGSLLRAERVALNFVQQLSGVATLTRRFVEEAGPGVTILDTRKTVPGLRPLQRYAVAAGGGANHRYNLSGSVLVKDNHVAAAGGVAEAVRRARRAGLPVEVEVDGLAGLEAALAQDAEVVLLDNLRPSEVAEAVRAAGGRAVLEVSGGVSLATVAAYAATGVDRISVGALTHSAPALDVSMEVRRTWR